MRSFIALALAAVSYANPTWSWESDTDNTDDETYQTISLTFDLSASYDIPMGWDGEGNYYFDTAVSAWIGGDHYVEYISPYFTFNVSAWTYAVWWDILYNELVV